MPFLFLLFALLADRAQSAPWSIVQVGDIHSESGYSTTTNDWPPFTNWIGTHLTDGDVNVKVVVTAGDVYDQNYLPGQLTPSSIYGTYLNALNVFASFTNFESVGLKLVACNGNHDADALNSDQFASGAGSAGSHPCTNGAEWNTWMGYLLTNQAGFISNRVSGDPRNMAFTYTNGNIRLLFLTYQWATNNVVSGTNWYNVSGAYAAQTQWMTNCAAQWPDHYVIVLGHYFLNRNSEMEYWDTGLRLYTNIGPAKSAFSGGLETVSNLLMVLSGHNRTSLKLHTTVQNATGNFCDVSMWNSQAFTNFTQLVNVITFYPDTLLVRFRTYDIYHHAWMTNGQPITMNDGLGTLAYFTETYYLPLPPAPAKRVIGVLKLK